MRELLAILAVIIAVLAMVMAIVTVTLNYNYRWDTACINAGGTKMKTNGDSGHKVCVRDPVVIIPIAVKPI